MPIDLRNKVVAVTGGSRGIGLATAEAFVAAGAKVAVGARDLERARAAAGRVGATAHALDVTDAQSVAAFYRDVESELGAVDVFVNNAGEMIVGSFEHESTEDSAHQLGVNLLGTLNGMKTAIGPMRARGSGHIINMVSAVGMIGLPGCATYSAAKHGVVGLSEGVRAELRGSGVQLSIVLPIPAQTELTSGVGKGRFVPLLTPDDIAKAVLRTARRPVYNRYVPGWTNPVTRSLFLLPQPWRDAMGRFLKADQLLRTTDFQARTGYEARLKTPAVDGGGR
ncbi:SDR family NAD(P)-dependent oxidoreductase [Streptomyces sp. NPDC017979]|uniref:SDR family NAD(P)-dependent oxidoreductase n=1 Tax=Streptomyces sp. NPDC017979 TaxID=3365024 RepID=UPI0037955C39